mmetsp:Transcript_5186/g.18637  ORF Transcript_5186/g.18637 Transcript_5186/m.18637 type:complete len:250 (+) Transcript_5186:178-927(+)
MSSSYSRERDADLAGMTPESEPLLASDFRPPPPAPPPPRPPPPSPRPPSLGSLLPPRAPRALSASTALASRNSRSREGASMYSFVSTSPDGRLIGKYLCINASNAFGRSGLVNTSLAPASTNDAWSSAKASAVKPKIGMLTPSCLSIRATSVPERPGMLRSRMMKSTSPSLPCTYSTQRDPDSSAVDEMPYRSRKRHTIRLIAETSSTTRQLSDHLGFSPLLVRDAEVGTRELSGDMGARVGTEEPSSM